MGPYCKFCNQRCFVPVPADPPAYATQVGSSFSILATCEDGKAHDQEILGWNLDTILVPRLEAIEAANKD